MPLLLVSWNVKNLGDRGQQTLKRKRDDFGVNAAGAISDALLQVEQDAGTASGGAKFYGFDLLFIMEVSSISGRLGVESIKSHFPRYEAYVTERTTGPGGHLERYAVVYNPAKIAAITEDDEVWPTQSIAGVPTVFPDRYPVQFNLTSKPTETTQRKFSVIVFHGPFLATRSFAGSQRAVRNLANLVAVNPDTPCIVCGDFNVDYGTYPSAYAGFAARSMSPQFDGNNRTTITPAPPTSPYLASAYDNIIVPTAWTSTSSSTRVMASGVTDYVGRVLAATDVAEAEAELSQFKSRGKLLSWQQVVIASLMGRVSDHLPVWTVIEGL